MGRFEDVELFNAGSMEENFQITDSARVTAGTVKWFDAVKGFGFVLSDEGGPDILLHANVLRNFGQSSIADGTIVELRVQTTPRGLQAVEVLSVAPPKDIEESSEFELITGDVSGISLTPARVKWFDKVKGFGFANTFGSSEDIFLHIEVLRRYGLADLQAGEAICIRIVSGDRGQMAAEVHSWDYGLTNS